MIKFPNSISNWYLKRFNNEKQKFEIIAGKSRLLSVKYFERISTAGVSTLSSSLQLVNVNVETNNTRNK